MVYFVFYMTVIAIVGGCCVTGCSSIDNPSEY